MSESPQAQRVMRHLTWVPGWDGSWVPEGAVFLKVGRVEMLPLGERGFSRTPCQPWLQGGEEAGLTELLHQPNGQRGCGHGQTEP